MIIGPKLEHRAEQQFVAIRSVVAMGDLPTVIPQRINEVNDWLGQQGVVAAGAPFIRYVVINMPGPLTVEIGFPVGGRMDGNGRILPGQFPAGSYATLYYVGDYAELMVANATLLDWGEGQGLEWDMLTTPAGDVFAARYETYVVGPDTQPDPAKWETEVVMKVKQGS